MIRIFKAITLSLALTLGILAGSTAHVSTQAPFLVFGSQSGLPVAIKSTSNALWVSLQSNASSFLAPDGTTLLPGYAFSGNTAIGLSRATGQLNISGNNIGIYPFSNATQGWLFNASGVLTNSAALTNATLPASAAGSIVYCSDCAPTTPATCPATKASCVCTGSGTGAFAIRLNGVWDCALFQ